MIPKKRNRLWLFRDKMSAFKIAGVFAANPEEKTKYSWAKSIKTYHAVPDLYKDFFIIFLDDNQEFPYTILIPSFENELHQTTEKLICNIENKIFILERNGNTFDTHCFPIERISFVEVRTILLDSSIKICGVNEVGVPDSSILRFNSVTDYLFTPILQKIRHSNNKSIPSPDRSEPEKFDQWRRVNFKFMSYAKRSLLAEEKVIHAILQSEIQEAVIRLLGRTYHRIVGPTLACILTDQELIMIREEKIRRRETRYGGIWDYIPLKKISTLSLSEKRGNLLELSVQLTEGTRLEYLFHSDARQEINQLQYGLRELVTSVGHCCAGCS